MTTHQTRTWYPLPQSFKIENKKTIYTVVAFAFERDGVLWLTMEGAIFAAEAVEARSRLAAASGFALLSS